MQFEFPAWDPVLFDIPGLPVDIRWYGVMYIVGFFVAQWILVRLARAKFLPVAPEVAPDLIFYCVIGVMLGGRCGYALFYQHELLNPLEFVKVWKGGLAFHGGLAGVAVACWLFVRRHKVGWGRVADACALAVTPGIFAVRMANFINGELFGRITSAATWGAMQFPTDPVAKEAMHIPEVDMRPTELCIQLAYHKRSWESIRPDLPSTDLGGAPIDWDKVRPYLDWEKVRSVVPFRHPSQVYEGLCEGVLIGLLLFVLYRLSRNQPWRPGRYTVVFLFAYAVARSSLELVRQPDPWLGPDVLWGLTMGQLLSGLMVVGAFLMLWSQRRRA